MLIGYASVNVRRRLHYFNMVDWLEIFYGEIANAVFRS